MIFLKLIFDDVCLGIGTMRSWLRSLLTDEAKLIHTCRRDLYKHFQGLNIGNYSEGCADKPKWRIDGNYLKNIGTSTAATGRKWWHVMLLQGGRAVQTYSEYMLIIWAHWPLAALATVGFQTAAGTVGVLSTPGLAQPGRQGKLHSCLWRWAIWPSLFSRPSFKRITRHCIRQWSRMSHYSFPHLWSGTGVLAKVSSDGTDRGI